MIFFIHKWGRFWAKIFFCTGVPRGRRYTHYVSCGSGGKGDVECGRMLWCMEAQDKEWR